MRDFFKSDMFMENAIFEKIKSSTNNSSEIYSENVIGNVKISRINIKDEYLEKEYRCRQGNHITVFTPKMHQLEKSELYCISEYVARELEQLIEKNLQSELKKACVLVVGLGNMQISTDSIGPLTASKILVTRHMELMSPDTFEAEGICTVSAINCGVMGETGLRSLEVIRGICEQISPHLIIAVDSLAARECDRLGSAVQMSDSGISPGAGIGNRQYALNRQTLGIPVIALGVPTVVSASSLIYDTVKKCNIALTEKETERLLCERKNFFVSPKECDIIAENASILMSNAINGALGVI